MQETHPPPELILMSVVLGDNKNLARLVLENLWVCLNFLIYFDIVRLKVIEKALDKALFVLDINQQFLDGLLLFG